MKRRIKIFAIIILSFAVTSFAFADVGEVAEEAAQAAPAAVAPQVSAPAAVTATETVTTTAASRKIRDTSLRDAGCESVTGVVECVLPSGIMRPRARITITDQAGARYEFIIKTLAVIYDPDGALMSLCDIGEGAKVQINYRVRPSGVNEATAIKVIR